MRKSCTGFPAPGFTPENGFRELGQDFDGVLYQSAILADKSLRALTTIALVARLPSMMVPVESKSVRET